MEYRMKGGSYNLPFFIRLFGDCVKAAFVIPAKGGIHSQRARDVLNFPRPLTIMNYRQAMK